MTSHLRLVVSNDGPRGARLDDYQLSLSPLDTAAFYEIAAALRSTAFVFDDNGPPAIVILPPPFDFDVDIDRRGTA